MRIVTSQNLGTEEKFEVIDTVYSMSIKSRNVFSQMGAGFKSLVGGKLGSFQKLFEEMKVEVIADLESKANQMGAEAIIAVRYQIDDIASVNGISFTAYGTAIKIIK